MHDTDTEHELDLVVARRREEAAGVELEYSCREGICGTCETTVIEGSVDHRDSILMPEEKEANDSMMVCVSRPAAPRLVLDC
jgi:ferredoxin